MKIYKSKSGKPFYISKFPAPIKDDIVTFTENEFQWMKDQCLTSDQFDFLWMAKKEDFRYPVIPQQEENKAQTIADKYCTEIINMYKGIKKN